MLIIRGDAAKALGGGATHRGGILAWVYSEGILHVPEELTFLDSGQLDGEDDPLMRDMIRAMTEPLPPGEPEHPELM